MKTIYNLVNRLNGYRIYGNFYIDQLSDGRYYIFTEYLSSKLICFSKNDTKWIIYPGLGDMNRVVQKDIMDFIYTTNSNHWFNEPEKKYNIIIGEDTNREYKSAYQKVGSNGVEVCDSVDGDDLALEMFIFTESEIEDLKSKVSTQSAKIIDIAKMEVKDED